MMSRIDWPHVVQEKAPSGIKQKAYTLIWAYALKAGNWARISY